MQIETFYDPRTYTLTYVVWDSASRDAVVIDPVLDFDPASGRIWRESMGAVMKFINHQHLKLHWVLETHAHADHLSGSQVLKQEYGAGVVIGEHIRAVQAVFKGVFDFPADFPTDGSQFDKLLSDGEVLAAGTLLIKAIHTPGHTPACMSFLIRDAVFTGDALFMPDYGVGRCDFPAGSAETLYTSVHDKLYNLPADTRVFVGHDYQPGGREVKWETTIGASQEGNVQLKGSTPAEDFVAYRKARDATLGAPRLLFPSVQVNIAAGSLPPTAPNGRRYFKIPVREA